MDEEGAIRLMRTEGASFGRCGCVQSPTQSTVECVESASSGEAASSVQPASARRTWRNITQHLHWLNGYNVYMCAVQFYSCSLDQIVTIHSSCLFSEWKWSMFKPQPPGPNPQYQSNAKDVNGTKLTEWKSVRTMWISVTWYTTDGDCWNFT